MTKERRLAIQMWEEIKMFIMASPEGSVKKFKQTFCREHGLLWVCSCWFCQYIKYCHKCPITGCALDSYSSPSLKGSKLYTQVVYGDTLEKRLDACDKIIKALKGEYRWSLTIRSDHV